MIGSLLAQRYRIESLLCRGGMGALWLATDTQAERPVVVKIIAREFVSHPVAVTRFLREMRIHTLVRDPHIVEVLDRGVDTNLGPYLVMEHLQGEDLDQRIRRSGPLDLAELGPVVAQVGAALQTIHDSGFVHRDVKPS
ncbi:MAG: serine/threonine-protein kinase, partial [Myxococcota bacterium]